MPADTLIVIGDSELAIKLQAFGLFDTVVDAPDPRNLPPVAARLISAVGAHGDSTRLAFLVADQGDDAPVRLAQMGFQVALLRRPGAAPSNYPSLEQLVLCDEPYDLGSVLDALAKLPHVALRGGRQAHVAVGELPSADDVQAPVADSFPLPPPPLSSVVPVGPNTVPPVMPLPPDLDDGQMGALQMPEPVAWAADQEAWTPGEETPGQGQGAWTPESDELAGVPVWMDDGQLAAVVPAVPGDEDDGVADPNSPSGYAAMFDQQEWDQRGERDPVPAAGSGSWLPGPGEPASPFPAPPPMLSDDLGVPDEGEQEWEQPASDPVEPGDIPPWLQVPPAAPRPQPPAQPAEQPAPLRPWEATERPVVMSEQFRPGPPPPLVSGDRQVHAVPLRDLMTGTNHPPVGPGAQPEPQATVRMWSDPGVERGRARGTSIVTVVPKGGTGKSSFTATCAARAATVLAGVNKRVCLVDANAQQSDISLYMGVQGRCATIAAISREPVIDEVTIKRAITTIEDYHLDVIFGSNNSQEVDPKVLSPMLYRRVVATLAGMYDYVFVDNQVAEPFSPMVREFALPAADRIMVVLDHNQVALDRVIHYLQEISGPRFNNVGQDVSLASIGIVLNMYQPQAKLTLDDIRAQMVGWNWWGKVPFMQSWKDANSAHRLCLDKDVQAAIDPILFMATGEAAFHEKAAKTAKGKGGKLLAWLTGEGKAQR